VRRILSLALIAATAGPAAAGPHHRERNFWEWVIDPDGAEIRVVLRKAEQNIRSAHDRGDRFGDEQSVQDALYQDARGMLRYGLRLQPDNPRLLLLLGTTCDELGRIDETVAALERYMGAEQTDRIQADARFRLGRAYARRGQLEAAAGMLRHGAGRGDADATLALAEVYQQMGRMQDAIDVLEHHLGRRTAMLVGGEDLVQLMLAIAYDRDEQLARAREVIDKLVAQRQRLLDVLALQRYGPRLELYSTADRHYAQAYVYELSGFLSDARAEWMHYAATGGPYRARALAHVRAIDSGTLGAVAPPPRPPINPPYPRPPVP
jgi:tetratricopeptide (TPR) repeat protein